MASTVRTRHISVSFCHVCCYKLQHHLIRRPAGSVWTHPSCLSLVPIRCAHTVFNTPISTSCITRCLKDVSQGYSRSGHRVRSSDLIFQNIQTHLTATTLEESISNYLWLKRVLIPYEQNVHNWFSIRIHKLIVQPRLYKSMRVILTISGCQFAYWLHSGHLVDSSLLEIQTTILTNDPCISSHQTSEVMKRCCAKAFDWDEFLASSQMQCVCIASRSPESRGLYADMR